MEKYVVITTGELFFVKIDDEGLDLVTELHEATVFDSEAEAVDFADCGEQYEMDAVTLEYATVRWG